MPKRPAPKKPDLSREFARVCKAAKAAKLPGVTEGPWYGTPALKVGGKGFMRVREPDVIVLLVSLDQKEVLMEAAPKIYFETDHYKGWPAVLVRLSKISDKELAARLTDAWRTKAPARLIAEFDQPAKKPAKAKKR
jgi:hypothetical protein